jgi:hypothetical protein
MTFDAYGYAREILLPSLGLGNHPFVVKATGREGTSSHLSRIVVERGPSLLVRSFTSRGRAARNGAALRLLADRGLPAPKLIFADISPANPLLRRRGLPRWATTEEWIDGIPAVEAAGTDLEKIALQVATILARYHGVTRGRWGGPGFPGDLRPFAAHTLATARRMLGDLVRRGIMKGSAAESARGRYDGWRRQLMKIGTFQLIHRDANRRNFVIPADKKAEGVIPIDLHRLSFGAGAEDIADALHHFCRSSESLSRRFIDRYLDEAQPASRLCWDRAGSFYIALNALKRLHKRTDPAAVNRISTADERMAEWMGQALHLAPPPLIWPEPGSAPPEREPFGA